MKRDQVVFDPQYHRELFRPTSRFVLIVGTFVIGVLLGVVLGIWIAL